MFDKDRTRESGTNFRLFEKGGFREKSSKQPRDIKENLCLPLFLRARGSPATAVIPLWTHVTYSSPFSPRASDVTALRKWHLKCHSGGKLKLPNSGGKALQHNNTTVLLVAGRGAVPPSPAKPLLTEALLNTRPCWQSCLPLASLRLQQATGAGSLSHVHAGRVCCCGTQG